MSAGAASTETTTDDVPSDEEILLALTNAADGLRDGSVMRALGQVRKAEGLLSDRYMVDEVPRR